jgi:hypothetical protein
MIDGEPLRVAVLMHLDGGPDSGVGRKVRSQVRGLSRLGADVRLFVGTPLAWVESWREVEPTPHVAHVPLDLPGVGGMRAIWAAQSALVREASQWRPHVTYTRQTIHYPGLVRAARTSALVVELNGDDLTELRAIAPRKHLLNVVTRGRHLSRASGFVSVTRELSKRPAFARYAKPTLVLGNGVDLGAHELLPPTNNTAPRLAFVGSPGMSWHGVDRLVELAHAFPAWAFDVVGSEPPRVDIPANMRFLGELYGAALVDVLRVADVGLGSLALERAGLSEASPLKSRTYLAHGLPVMAAYVDTDFPGGSDAVLELPAGSGALRAEIPRMAAFVERWTGRRVPRSAVLHIDDEAKARQRMEFLVARVTRGDRDMSAP